MKRILLGTTALLGASAIGVGASSAMPIQSFGEGGEPILSASIVGNFEMGIASNDDQPNVFSNSRDGAFVGGRFAEINFKGELTADNGLVYGAVIVLHPDVITNTFTFPGRKYVYLSGGWGTLQLGDWIEAASLLSVEPLSTRVFGNGGLDFAHLEYIDIPGVDMNPVPNNGLWFTIGTNISYLSPKVAGFQLGVAYTPNTQSVGANIASPADRSFTRADFDGASIQCGNIQSANLGTGFGASGCRAGEDVWSGGIRHTGEWGPITTNLSLVGGIGHAQDESPAANGLVSEFNERDGVGVWSVAGTIDYAGFVVGGEYYDNGSGPGIATPGTSRFRKEKDIGWSLMGGYTFGPVAIGVEYMHNEVESRRNSLAGVSQAQFLAGNTGFLETSEVDAFAVEMGYTAAPGLKFYVDVDYFDYDGAPSCSPGCDNEATAFIGGMYVSF